MLKCKDPLHGVPGGPHNLKWSASEKKAARRAYEVALERALAKNLAEFKVKAAAAATPAEMWAIEDYLRLRRREVDEIFDYRYSILLFVFARLIHEGFLEETRLSGLSGEKQEIVRRILSQIGSE